MSETTYNKYYIDSMGNIKENLSNRPVESFGTDIDSNSLNIILEEIAILCSRLGISKDDIFFSDNNYTSSGKVFNFDILDNNEQADCETILNKFPSYGQLNYIHTYNLNSDYITTPDTKKSYRIFGKLLFKEFLNQVKYKDNYGWDSRCNNIPFAVFTIGKDKLVFGTIYTNGKISLCRAVLDILLSDRIFNDIIIEIIENIIKFNIQQKKNFYKEFDVNNVSSQLLSASISKLFSSGYSKMEIKELVHVFSSMVKNILESDGVSSSVLYNRASIYREKMLEYIERDKSIRASAFKDGMNAGLKVFTPLHLAGYCFNSLNGYWEKEVNIVPKYCIKDRRTWEFLPKKVNYEITKLYFNMDDFISSFGGGFHIKAIGHHPNVSGNNVCIGDLGSEWNDIMNLSVSNFQNIGDLNEKIKTFLLKVETTLEIPNFDSAFEQLNNFSSKVKDGEIVLGINSRSNTENRSFTYLD